MKESTKTSKSAFAKDVDKGLSSDPKYLSSKYFYDDEGSRLFQEIMKLPEYYLTRAEMEVFTEQGDQIYKAFGADGEDFDLIELGAGDGTKTAVLVDYFLKKNADFSFVPIDISSEAIDSITRFFNERFPRLQVEPEVGDYFATLETFRETSDRRKIILFLGSNIGNFSEEQAVSFFSHLREVVSPDDRILIGFDLHKNPRTILNAYDDSLGVTPKFNLNLLKRINRELGGNFNVDKFVHYAGYHPLERAARSFLISEVEQTVKVESLGKEFHFRQWEPIFMEISQKYDLPMIEKLANDSGFEVVENFFDSNRFYADSMWKPAG
ncbi:MAG: L-histidine N(alpha)-methyltransferase [Acidobacteria bacterium]|nr:MAG: L-histidine N(alpha)-methyltransferase [Acidobacteriota bacterium]REK02214.1 MAG: L-histidine N(alpha)-methyltransferase [Acidobacteriota bacterium]REK13983.1 MAG: L-histidine N(alpha)-methyltransferase [Acidobacteriota bacterium]REK41978.1 MAG: L-histidine N(alpha)-methyltransferase [Acidobacteriota bacterium]